MHSFNFHEMLHKETVSGSTLELLKTALRGSLECFVCCYTFIDI